MDANRNLIGRAKSVVQVEQSDPTTRSESVRSFPVMMLPSLVAHADWSTDARKRWMTCAIRVEDRYRVGPPEPVGDTGTLLRRLQSAGDGGPILIGFDF